MLVDCNSTPTEHLKVESMVPVKPELQALLEQLYGIQSHMKAYFRRGEPNRIYVNVSGQLHFIDLPLFDPRNGTLIQNFSSDSDENELAAQNDLDSELEKVLQRVLSRLSEKRRKNRASLDENSLKSSSTTWQMLTDTEREKLQRERRKKNAFKTSLCRSFREGLACPYGDECVFAHGEDELRLPPQAHPKYKTQLCNKFSVWNYCPYGARCQYIHQRINNSKRFDTEMKLQKDKNLRKNSKKIFLSSTSLSRLPVHLLVGNKNKSINYVNSPIALGNHSSFAEHAGFSSSLTGSNLNYAENSDHFFKASSKLTDQRIANCGKQTCLDLETFTKNIKLNQLTEHFEAMKIENSSRMFSQSCFSRIGTSSLQ